MESGIDTVELRADHSWHKIDGLGDPRARQYVFKHMHHSSEGNADERFFLSWSTTLVGVRQVLHAKNTGSFMNPIGGNPAGQKVVRVDLDDMFDRGLYHDGSHVDLSNEEVFLHYFEGGATAGFDPYGDTFMDFSFCQKRASNWKEAIWGIKGEWWLDYVTVVDPLHDYPTDDQTGWNGICLLYTSPSPRDS